MFGLFTSTDPDAEGPQNPPALSLLGEGSTATGTFQLGDDDLRIDGTLEGEVRSTGRVQIASEGAVRGDVRAGSIRVVGTVRGILCARGDLLVSSEASVRGILCADSLTIEKGADFDGGLCRDPGRIPDLKESYSFPEGGSFPTKVGTEAATGPSAERSSGAASDGDAGVSNDGSDALPASPHLSASTDQKPSSGGTYEAGESKVGGDETGARRSEEESREANGVKQDALSW